MVGRRRVTQNRLDQAEQLLSMGKEIWEVAAMMSVSHRTVTRYLAALRESGRWTQPPKEGGRPPKITDRMLRTLRREALHGISTTQGDLQRHLAVTEGLDVSKRTIMDRLRGRQSYLLQEAQEVHADHRAQDEAARVREGPSGLDDGRLG